MPLAFLHPFQRLGDPTLGNRREQARLRRPVLQPVAHACVKVAGYAEVND